MTDKTNRLDDILNIRGSDVCKEEFRAVCRESAAGAAALLNAPELTFHCFLELLPVAEEYGLTDSLDDDRRTAVLLTQNILGPNTAGAPGLPVEKDRHTRDVLRWMLLTGLSGERESRMRSVLDVAVSVLLGTYGESDLLETVCDMIVRRAARGYNTHYLVWAYFGTGNPTAVRLMARYLDSERPAERRAAARLLGVDPENAGECAVYKTCHSGSDVIFTKESPQYTGKPVFCRVESGGEKND